METKKNSLSKEEVNEIVESEIRNVQEYTHWDLSSHEDLKITPIKIDDIPEYLNPNRKLSEEERFDLIDDFMERPAFYSCETKEIIYAKEWEEEMFAGDLPKIMRHELTHYGQDKKFPYAMERIQGLRKIFGISPEKIRRHNELSLEFLILKRLIEGHARYIEIVPSAPEGEFSRQSEIYYNKLLAMGIGDIKQRRLDTYDAGCIIIYKRKLTPAQLDELYLNQEKRNEVFKNVLQDAA